MVTSLYAGILGLMFLYLSILVVKARQKFRVALDHAQNFEVLRKTRTQGNFAEYSMFFLILLGYAELNHLPSYIIHLLGLVFIAGRLLHAYSLLYAEQFVDGKLTAPPKFRLYGMICTIICIGALALISVDQYFMSLFK